MSVQWSTPELAGRFAAYVDELQEFFASSSIHYGSPCDIALLNARLDDVESLRDDFSSLVRSIILRQGGVMPRAQLLEIVAIAIGGTEIDQPGPEIQQSMRQLLTFLNGVAGKPWNQPPGESRLKTEPVPAVVHEMPAPASRPDSPPAKPSELPGETPIESYGAMLAARHKIVPISTHRSPASREAEPAARHTELPIASGGTLLAQSAHGEGVFSRLSHVERQADTRPGPTPGPVPSPIPNPIPPPPPPPAEATAASGAPSPEVQPVPAALPPIPASVFAPVVAAELLAHPAIDPQSASTPELEPVSQPALAAKHASRFAFPRFTLPDLKFPAFQLPRFTLPKFSFPKFALPALSLPKKRILPKLSRPRMPLPKFSIAGISPLPMFVLVLMAACVAVVATVRAFVAPAHPQSVARILPQATPTAEAAANPTPAAAPPVETAAAAPATMPEPSTTPPHKPSPYGSPRYDNYIAPPYSRTIPGQSAAAAAAPSNPASQPGATDAAAVSAVPVRTARPLNPDATYVGATPEERVADSASLPPAPRRRYPAVSSGVMRNNLVSAPEPGYPLLAKIAHLQGQVVVQAVVAPDGTVADAHALRGHRLLRGAAVDAVRRWRYRPYTIDGRPAEVSTIVTLSFPSGH